MRSKQYLIIAAYAVGPILVCASACLRSVEVRPDTTADGRPLVEVCAEFAKTHGGAAVASAAPSGAPRAVATVAPSAAPAIPRVE